ncbi:MAG: phosphatidate cytidylyltransferase, partial [Rhodothermales bacterium]|nr:phosphatidate cytidylyltransferase [Rhodothermales bacterium]
LGGGALVDDAAFALTLTVFLLIWATDTFAYYVGKNLGRHKLAPLISPKKTWEGAVGGAVGALLVAVVLKLTLLAFLAWPHVVAMALICGIVSQIGDLAESRLKRSVGAKDSGTLLPGHGGLLDRFDALLLAVPLVYLYLAYVARLFA